MKSALTLLAALMLAPLISLHASTKPNVLFIAVDDLRPDLGCYGNTIIKTPNIDRIAARGIVFNKAYCQQSVCGPSRTAIMTGLRPDVTKVWDLETHFRVAQPDCITLPQHFKANGYHCAAIGKIYHVGFEDGRSWNEPHWYPKGRAVDTDPVDWAKQIVTRHDVDTEEYSAPREGGEPRKSGKSAKKGPAYEVSPKPDEQLPDGATAVEAAKRLAALKAKNQPFFLAIGFAKPHLPFVAPKKYWDLYDPGSIPLPATDKLPAGSPEFAGHKNSELHAYPGVPKENPIPADFAKTLRHGYYACVSYTDAQIGKVLDALEKEGLAENTIIVLWGDHGWQLGEHGLWHKHTNFEIAARSPLLISVPGTRTAGRKCEAPVEFVDVYPTLAEVCGLPIPNGLGGSSLKNFIENPAAPATDVAISQYPRSSPVGPVMGYSIRNDRYRATFWRERNGSKIIAAELYDGQADPNETISLADKPEHKELLETLITHLPPVGSDLSPGAKSKGKGKSKSPTKPTTPSTDGPRDVRYDRLYPGKPKLTLDEYLGRQSNSDEGKERFARFDSDKDGLLSREEFIKGGK
jgi:arylsulfatase A-like enzyme